GPPTGRSSSRPNRPPRFSASRRSGGRTPRAPAGYRGPGRMGTGRPGTCRWRPAGTTLPPCNDGGTSAGGHAVGRGRSTGRRHERPHRPHELGPRLFRRGRWWAADLRPWGGGRVTLRDPRARGWPRKGERTEHRDIAEKWKWAYVEYAQSEARARQLGIRDDQRTLGDA